MINLRNQYSRDFKANAVKLSNERTNVSELARELGIKASLLYRWRLEQEKKGSESFPGNGKQYVSSEQEELIALRKELKRKDMELEILKKAVSIISKSDL
jgi:transposase